MEPIRFDGELDTAELIALDCLMEDLSEEGRINYIQRYKKIILTNGSLIKIIVRLWVILNYKFIPYLFALV